MGKSKSKSRKEVEHLRGVIRSLKKQLRNRQAQEGTREKKESDDFETCSRCGKGTLSFKDFVHVKFLVCDVCDFREKIENAEEES